MNLGVNCNPVGGGGGFGECNCTAPQDSICGQCRTPVGLGQPCKGECSQTPCASGLLCSGGTCVDTLNFSGTGPGAICGVFPNAATNCGTGFYCRSKSCPESIADGYDHCSAYVQQGDACGASDPCEQCEPGTSCVDGFCAASCNGTGSAADCAVMCGGQLPLCLALGTDGSGDPENIGDPLDNGGYCYRTCASGTGAACNGANPCCDFGNACAGGSCCQTDNSYKLGGNQCSSNGDCCAGYLCRQQQNGVISAGGPSACVSCGLTNGTNCTTDSQCCQGSGYHCLQPSGGPGQTTCQTCHHDDTYCGGGSDCCSGQCTMNLCVPKCNEGASCTVPGAKGPCAAGKMDCTTDPQQPTCKSSYMPTSDANCNGKDEDCDGVIDNGYVPTACMTTPTGCQAGFQAPGMTKCEPGNSSADHVVCVATACTPTSSQGCYCLGGDDGTCGWTGTGNGCIPGQDVCTPGYVCRVGQLIGCQPQDNTNGCFPINTCNPCVSTTCWLPSQLKAGLDNATCP